MHNAVYMIQIMRYAVVLLVSTCFRLAHGESTTSANNLFYCPLLSTLQKDTEKRTWSAPGGWQSYDLSFVDKVDKFSGAQWRGTNVGQIFCVYRGDIPTMFPILLAYGTLALEPSGQKWGENLGGYRNCESSVREDCPFQIRLEPEQGDIYEEAEKLRKLNPSQRSLGY